MLRIYLVLSVLWVGVIAAASITERPRPVVLVTKTQFGDPIDEPHRSQFGDLPADPWEAAAVERREEQIRHAANYSRERADYWGRRGFMAITPPLVGCIVIFGVVPWIGRGFRSTRA